MKNLFIGIDAGVHTGVAIFNNSKLIELQSLNTYQTICFLQQNIEKINTVIIEDSKKQSYIWNKNNKSSSALGRHARNIGSVDGKVQVFKEACEELKINIISISPKDKGSKWDHKTFLHYFHDWKGGKTNQHERDAVKCVRVAMRF